MDVSRDGVMTMDVLTVSEASKLCGVSLKTITNWIEQGHIKAHKTVGGHRRILERGPLQIHDGAQDPPAGD